MSYADALLFAKRGGWDWHNIRRLLRFGFDASKLRNFQNVRSEQSNVNAPKVCVLISTRNLM